jgi:hypothetical protein
VGARYKSVYTSSNIGPCFYVPCLDELITNSEGHIGMFTQYTWAGMYIYHWPKNNIAKRRRVGLCE